MTTAAEPEAPYEVPATVGIEVQVSAKEVWSEVFGAYPTYWGWTDVHFLEGDWDTPGKARVRFWNPDTGDDMGEKVLTIEDIAASINALGGQREDLDSMTSDAILQHAVIGEVVMG